MNAASLMEILEGASYIATALGIPIALWIFIHEKRRERKERAEEAYFRSNDRYVHYLTLCLEHLDADAFDPDVKLIGTGQKRAIMFSILISTFETAFLMFEAQPLAVRIRQWRGWHNYLTVWAREPEFVRVWESIGQDFDLRFQRYVAEAIEQGRSGSER